MIGSVEEFLNGSFAGPVFQAPQPVQALPEHPSDVGRTETIPVVTARNVVIAYVVIVVLLFLSGYLTLGIQK